MKNRILILEDNYYTYFTAKQLVETQLRVQVDTVVAKTESAMVENARDLKPAVVICRPKGGVLGLLELLRKRGINRRNATVTFMVTPDLDQRLMGRLCASMDEMKARQMFGSLVASAA